MTAIAATPPAKAGKRWACEARIGTVLAERDGFPSYLPRLCGQRVGVRAFLGADGAEHAYCGIVGHEAAVRHRHPEYVRRTFVAECPMCDAVRAHGFGPSHDASPYCRSGRGSHCTCGSCFD